MPLSPPALRRFVHQALVSTAGVPNPTPEQLIAAFDTLCDRLRGRLQPIFGTPATVGLFTRAFHLAAKEYPWLGQLTPNLERCSLAGFDAVSCPPDRAAFAEGIAAVLAQDIGLLTAFIGEEFVMPLVQDAWGDASTSASRSATSKGDQ